MIHIVSVHAAAGDSGLSGVTLLILIAGVLAGAIVPVVPTGALVSTAAVVAAHDEHGIFKLLAVMIAGAAGAYIGDLVMYAMCRYGGERLATRFAAKLEAHHARAVEERLEAHDLSLLLLSRLVPGGRVPVLLAAGAIGYPWARFVVADLAACGLWSLVYALIGILGAVIFPEPWEGIVAAIALVILVTVAGRAIGHWRLAHRVKTA